MEEIKLKVNMTEKALFDFLFYHTYSKFSGFMTNILGFSVIVLGLLMTVTGRTETIQLGYYVLAGIAFIGYTPFLLWRRAKKSVKQEKEYQEETEYVFGDEGIERKVNEERNLILWEEIEKIVPTPKTIGFYYEAEKALIIPKEDIQQDFVEIMQVISRHLPRYKVKMS